jgi:hypothetical protein
MRRVQLVREGGGGRGAVLREDGEQTHAARQGRVRLPPCTCERDAACPISTGGGEGGGGGRDV